MNPLVCSILTFALAALTKAPGGVEVTLKAKASTTETSLIIGYRISNSSARPIFVWDLTPNYNKEQIVDPDSAYVFWQEPVTLRVVRAQLQSPADFDVTKKEVPYVRRLELEPF